MITIINALQQVTGSEKILLGTIFCIVIFIGIFIKFKSNRNKKSILTYLVALLVILELCDFIWFSYLFPGGNYLNRGLVGGWILLILPVLLLFLNISLTQYNRHKVL
jgi:hypothetical protein